MKLVMAAAALAVLVVPTIARAQTQEGEQPWAVQGVAAPSQAFELTVGTGYTQPFGELRRGLGMPQVAREGIGVDVGAGYRADPHWGLSIGGQYQELNAQNNVDAARGLAFTLAAQYHIVPQARLDPWVEIGTGYRMLWQVTGNNNPTVLNHGFELARARAGFDLRISPDVAIAPVVGADATVFLWQDAGDGSVAIADPRVSTFIFAGLQGRLDVGGTKVATVHTTSADTELE
jgi:outer membrane protein W